MKESCFCHMDLIPKKLQCCFNLRNKKKLTPLLALPLKKHYSEIMNERRQKEDFSALFYYLSYITDRKQDTNQHCNNVNLSPVDCSISFIKSISKINK